MIPRLTSCFIQAARILLVERHYGGQYACEEIKTFTSDRVVSGLKTDVIVKERN